MILSSGLRLKKALVTGIPSVSKSLDENLLLKETIRRKTYTNFDFPIPLTISLTEAPLCYVSMLLSLIWNIVTANFKVCTSRISEGKIKLNSLTCLKFRVVQGILQRISYFEG